MDGALKGVQGQELQGSDPPRLVLAHFKRPVTPLEAQRALEEGLAKVQGFDEAVAWLKQNPKVAENLTPMGLIMGLGDIPVYAVTSKTLVAHGCRQSKTVYNRSSKHDGPIV